MLVPFSKNILFWNVTLLPELSFSVNLIFTISLFTGGIIFTVALNPCSLKYSSIFTVISSDLFCSTCWILIASTINAYVVMRTYKSGAFTRFCFPSTNPYTIKHKTLNTNNSTNVNTAPLFALTMDSNGIITVKGYFNSLNVKYKNRTNAIVPGIRTFALSLANTKLII